VRSGPGPGLTTCGLCTKAGAEPGATVPHCEQYLAFSSIGMPQRVQYIRRDPPGSNRRYVSKEADVPYIFVGRTGCNDADQESTRLGDSGAGGDAGSDVFQPQATACRVGACGDDRARGSGIEAERGVQRRYTARDGGVGSDRLQQLLRV